MTETRTQSPPVILIVDDDEWRARSLESVFKSGGYAVIKVYTGKQAVEVLPRIAPQVVITVHHLPDTTGTQLLGEMRRHVRLNTPLLLLAPQDLPRNEQLDALREGAWEVLCPPLDPEQILLRVGTFVAAKNQADEALEASLVDPAVGCYNLNGLLRRSEELAADAARHHRDLACIVVGCRAQESSPAADGKPLRMTAAVLQKTIRVSDALACLADGEFVVVAPGTDTEGAHRLAERILSALDAEGSTSAAIRAGVTAISFDEAHEVASNALLSQARAALRATPEASSGSNRIARYHRNGT